MTTRRDFITGCSVLAAAAALRPATLVCASDYPTARTCDLPGLTAFAAQVGNDFRVQLATGASTRLRLLDARPLPTANPATAEHQFSLLFRGPASQLLEQEIHTLEHAVLGQLTLFLATVLQRETSQQYYEAIFNRCPGPVV